MVSVLFVFVIAIYGCLLFVRFLCQDFLNSNVSCLKNSSYNCLKSLNVECVSFIANELLFLFASNCCSLF